MFYILRVSILVHWTILLLESWDDKWMLFIVWLYLLSKCLFINKRGSIFHSFSRNRKHKSQNKVLLKGEVGISAAWRYLLTKENTRRHRNSIKLIKVNRPSLWAMIYCAIFRYTVSENRRALQALVTPHETYLSHFLYK